MKTGEAAEVAKEKGFPATAMAMAADGLLAQPCPPTQQRSKRGPKNLGTWIISEQIQEASRPITN